MSNNGKRRNKHMLKYYKRNKCRLHNKKAAETLEIVKTSRR